ncbi:hypothetical protein L207DRAFT_642757 [Hyaloscypha variabilis F]|uniref:Transmembrane protein n=1 Tax=Hyaloscypha variabilis (strain UAMH 11265 / GT02V1 / F) TaxID=1149755 RepID=A0A2J6QRQ9_HYAVF|nr:hypothetical protein L207DRAFT_642757 [Hyaloscypha variabilis F]
MDNQEKTPRDLEENTESSPFLDPPSPPPPSYISHVTYNLPTSIPFVAASPRASSESSHSSYRDKFIIEEYNDKRRSRKAILIFVGGVGIVALVIALTALGGVYHWGKS